MKCTMVQGLENDSLIEAASFIGAGAVIGKIPNSVMKYTYWDAIAVFVIN